MVVTTGHSFSIGPCEKKWKKISVTRIRSNWMVIK